MDFQGINHLPHQLIPSLGSSYPFANKLTLAHHAIEGSHQWIHSKFLLIKLKPFIVGNSHLASLTVICPHTSIAPHLLKTQILMVLEEAIKLLMICFQVLALAKHLPQWRKLRVSTLNSDTVLATVCIHEL
jgi:hypothetical protein